MLYVQRQKLDDVHDLRNALANAIKLELSTIPPYLTALYSIKQNTNTVIAANIRTIVVQEMLHLSLASNILNAVGGVPDFPHSVPKYPGRLPMNIGSEPGKPFIVPLKKLSHDTVKNVFMVIEEPENPIIFPEKKLAMAAAPIAPDYHTIGEFYEAVKKLIKDLGGSIFTGDKSRQVTGWFGPQQLFAVDSVETAVAAIDLIVTQGEGTDTSPAGGSGLAHYYRFEEIARGQTLMRDLPTPPHYSWGPPPVVLDEANVWPVVDNAPDVPLPKDSPVAALSTQCDRTFSALIDALQLTFDGTPNHLDAAVGLMYTLRLQAQELVSMPVPGLNANAGPRFLYDAATASG